MELISVIHNSLALKEFIEKDLASHLVSIELNAAADALAGLDKAKDKGSVYWSAINHLEVVEQSLKSRLDSHDKYLCAKEYLYVSALKGTIYKYLSEDGLVQKCCDDSVSVVNTHNNNEKNHYWKTLAQSWNPFGWLRLGRYLNSSLGKKAASFEANKFWQKLLNRNEYFDLFQNSYDPNDSVSY